MKISHQKSYAKNIIIVARRTNGRFDPFEIRKTDGNRVRRCGNTRTFLREKYTFFEGRKRKGRVCSMDRAGISDRSKKSEKNNTKSRTPWRVHESLMAAAENGFAEYFAVVLHFFFFSRTHARVTSTVIAYELKHPQCYNNIVFIYQRLFKKKIKKTGHKFFFSKSVCLHRVSVFRFLFFQKRYITTRIGVVENRTAKPVVGAVKRKNCALRFRNRSSEKNYVFGRFRKPTPLSCTTTLRALQRRGRNNFFLYTKK